MQWSREQVIVAPTKGGNRKTGLSLEGMDFHLVVSRGTVGVYKDCKETFLNLKLRKFLQEKVA